MGIVTIFTNPLSLSVIATIMFTFPLPFILSYIFKNSPKHFIILVTVSLFIATTLLHFIISIYSSEPFIGICNGSKMSKVY